MKINSHCSNKINTSMEKDFPTVDNFKNRAVARRPENVIERPGHKNFNAVFLNRARPEVLFSNLKHGN